MSWTGEILRRRVVVLVGAGGVGKTTTAAAVGLHAARAGRRVLVLTIDPARRLADALGIRAIGNVETRVALDGLPGAERGGAMSAMMLDTEAAFEDLVGRLATDPERARAVRENRIYRHIIDSLAGAQEYLAGERICEAATCGRYDLVVLDTPPTSNALEFLDASRRLARLLDDRVYRWLLPTVGTERAGLVDRLLRAPSNVVKALLARVFGDRFVGDLEEFFLVMRGIHVQVRERSERVQDLLKAPGETAFVLVATPLSLASDEAAFFREQITRRGYPFAGLIINRVHPELREPLAGIVAGAGAGRGQEAAEETLAGHVGGEPAEARAVAAALLENARVMHDLAQRDRRAVGALRMRLGASAATVTVPRLPADVHDLDGLAAVGGHIFGAASPGR